MSPKKTPFSSDGRRFFFWINHYFCSHVFECGEVVFFQGRIKWLLKGFDVHPKNVSFLQDQVGHFVQCEMPLYKRIYRLEVLDGQMAHSFKTLTSTGLPLDFGNLDKNWIWKAPWKPWISRFLRPRTLNNGKYPSFSNVTLLERLNCVALPLQVDD